MDLFLFNFSIICIPVISGYVVYLSSLTKSADAIRGEAFSGKSGLGSEFHSIPRITDTFEKYNSYIIPQKLVSSRRIESLRMTRKVVFGYKYDAERAKRKGKVKSQIYFDMWKDKNPYYLIHRFFYENDPDNKNFNYDIDLATKKLCTRNIFAHYKKDNKLRFFWYASGKKKPKGPCSRYINYSISVNEFRFSKLRSFYHILPYVHEHYKSDPRYIYYMNKFLSRHGRAAKAKREMPDSVKGKSEYRRDASWRERQKMEENELLSRYSNMEAKVVNLGDGKSFVVKPDGFSVHGEYYSRVDKSLRKTPYDIYHPFYRTKDSSKRRRFRERGIPIDPSERSKTRRERLLKNAEKRRLKHQSDSTLKSSRIAAYHRPLLKQKKSFRS